MADEVEQGGRCQAWALPHHFAMAPAVTAVLQRLVGGPADGVLDEAIAGDPAGLLGVPELR